MANYDPTYSVSFRLACEAAPETVENGDEAYWRPILEAASVLMDDDIREDLHAKLAPGRSLLFLERYMERHYQKYREHFEW